MALMPYYPIPETVATPWLVAPQAVALADEPQALLAVVATQNLTAADRATFARAAIAAEQSARCRMPVLKTLTSWLKEVV